jgi:hypothetical protein
MIGYAVTGAAFLILVLYLGVRAAGRDRLALLAGYKVLPIVVSVILSAVFIGLLAGSIAFATDLDRSHDIDDAVGAACVHFVHGGNPYRDEVVPRFTEIYHEGVEIENGTLNYLPLTLFVYSGAYLLLGFIGPAWFEVSNILFGIVTAFVLAAVFPKLRRSILFPSVGIVTVFFAFDNIMLTILLFSAFLFFLIRSRARFRILFALVFLFLAFSVKMAAMLSLGVFVLFLVQRYRLRDGEVNLQLAIFFTFAAAASIGSIALFGFGNLMDSTFLFMSDPAVRSDGAYFGGTILAEIVGDSPMFSIVSYSILLAVLAGTLFVKGLVNRLFMAEAILPFVTVKDSQSLLAIPLLLLFVGSMAVLDPDIDRAMRGDAERER